MSRSSFTFSDEGTIDGVQYVTVLDLGWNPMEYNIPLSDAIARYGQRRIVT